ncbi:hypothetical protein ANTPLA_LOCUS5623 [Anthophora plagiata]
MNFAKAERRLHGWSSSLDRPILFHAYPASLQTPLGRCLDPQLPGKCDERKEISIVHCSTVKNIIFDGILINVTREYNKLLFPTRFGKRHGKHYRRSCYELPWECNI